MVEMYVWLLVTLAVAVGVLALAGILTSGDRVDSDDDADDAPASAWSAMWQDFLAGTSDVRAQLARVRHRMAGTPAPQDTLPRTGRGRTAGHPRAGRADKPASGADLPATAAPRRPAPRPAATSRHDRGTTESNTSFEEFFEAAATSEPAYLDAAQVSDALHSLRR